MEYRPYYYQEYAEQFILDNPEAGLLLDMGMGKTVVSLTAADKLLNDYFAVRKVLVIAPLKPAKETWLPEIKKWDHLQHLTTSLVIGSKQSRVAALEQDADIYIINRENIVWLVDYYKSKWPFDMVIIDELSSFKSSKAQRFRALKKVRKYIKRIVGLTGTPSQTDFWTCGRRCIYLTKVRRLVERLRAIEIHTLYRTSGMRQQFFRGNRNRAQKN